MPDTLNQASRWKVWLSVVATIVSVIVTLGIYGRCTNAIDIQTVSAAKEAHDLLREERRSQYQTREKHDADIASHQQQMQVIIKSTDELKGTLEKMDQRQWRILETLREMNGH